MHPFINPSIENSSTAFLIKWVNSLTSWFFSETLEECSITGTPIAFEILSNKLVVG